MPQPPPPEIIRLLKYREWTNACNGHPAFIHGPISEYMTPEEKFPDFGYRTTWARIGDKWYQLELAKNWKELADPKQLLPGIASVSITIFHKTDSSDLRPFQTTITDIVPMYQPREYAERHRRTYRDANEGTEKPADWTRFNVSRSLRALSSGAPGVKRRELRKLHLRWWHASIGRP